MTNMLNSSCPIANWRWSDELIRHLLESECCWGSFSVTSISIITTQWCQSSIIENIRNNLNRRVCPSFKEHFVSNVPVSTVRWPNTSTWGHEVIPNLIIALLLDSAWLNHTALVPGDWWRVGRKRSWECECTPLQVQVCSGVKSWTHVALISAYSYFRADGSTP